MLLVVLFLLELLALSLALSRIASIPLSVCPGLVSALSVLLLYLADFAGLMHVAALGLHCVGFVVVCYWLIVAFRNPLPLRNADSRIISRIVEISAIAILLIALYVKNAPGAFREWDEFSHWGTVIKLIYLANSFHVLPSPLHFQDYPPGSALFAYFVLSFIGYSEGKALFSHALLTALFLLPIIGYARRDGWVLPVVVGMASIYLVQVLGSGWTTVLIESHLSVVAAGALFVYLRIRKTDNAWIWTGLLLAFLALIKHAGQSLALLIATIILVDGVLHLYFSESPQRGCRTILKRIGKLTVGVFALPILTIWSWNSYVGSNNLVTGFAGVSSLQFLADALSCCSTEREFAVITRFFQRHFGLINDPASVGSIVNAFLSSLSNIDWTISIESVRYIPKAILALEFYLVGLFFILFGSDRRERVRYIIQHTLLGAGCVLYSGSILLYYLYGFSEYEARLLISYDRYHNVYFLMWGLLILYLVVDILGRIEGIHKIAMRLMMVILVTASIWFDREGQAEIRKLFTSLTSSDTAKRREIKSLLTKMESHIPISAGVYIGWQGSKGLEYLQVKHELLPRRTNMGCYSIGDPLYEGDIWTCKYSESEIRNALSNYDYYLVGRGLQSLSVRFSALMDGVPPGRDSGLLKIDKQSGQLRLKYIDVDS